ncbi:MAG: hypothetical protein ACK5B9_14790 [Flavobacteriia bacterium]
MKKAKFLLFSLLIFSFGIGQDSYEMSLGYNYSFDKIDQGLSNFTVLEKNRNGMIFNYLLNFRKDKILNSKFGFTYNYNSIFVKYSTKSNQANSDLKINSDSQKEHFLQFNSLIKFNVSDFETFGFSPQIGLNVNFFTKFSPKNTSNQDVSYNSYFGPVFYLDFISGFQFERVLGDKLSFIADLNYIRKFYIWERSESYFDSKNEFRFSAGFKKNLNPVILDSNKKSFYFGVSLLNYLYTFENKNDDYSNDPYYDGYVFISTSGSSKRVVTQSGLNLIFVLEKNRFHFSNEFTFSNIDIEIDYDYESTYTYKMSNPFILAEESSSEGRFKAQKKEFEYNFGIGYDLFKNDNVAFIPKIGLSYVSNTNALITEDYSYSHYYKDLYVFTDPNPEHVITDEEYYGKASDNIELFTHSIVVPKLSVLLNVKLFRPLFLNLGINRYLISFNHFEQGDIIDVHKYQLSLGLSYKIR